MTLGDTQQTAAARAAAPGPRAAGRVCRASRRRDDFPAAVVSGLELNGHATERVYDDGRIVGVRLLKPEPRKSTRRTPPPAAALAAPIASRRTPRDPREWPDPPGAPDRQATRGTDRPSTASSSYTTPGKPYGPLRSARSPMGASAAPRPAAFVPGAAARPPQVGLAFAWRRFPRPHGASLGSQRAARGRVYSLVAIVPADPIARRRIAAQDLLNDTRAGSTVR